MIHQSHLARQLKDSIHWCGIIKMGASFSRRRSLRKRTSASGATPQSGPSGGSLPPTRMSDKDKLYEAIRQSSAECFEDVGTMILSDCDSDEVKRIVSSVDNLMRYDS